jgi:hypothetical protein
MQSLLEDDAAMAGEAHKFHMLIADAYDRMGADRFALKHYREALKLKPMDDRAVRNLAFTLLQVAPKVGNELGKKLFDEAVGLYRGLLETGELTDADRQQVTLALATRSWNRGDTEDAKALLAEAKGIRSPSVERILAAEAIGKKDYKAASHHLQRALELDRNQPDVEAMLANLSHKPVISKFRVNRLGEYDPRPILAATLLPKAVPTPISADNVKMTLDGETVEPLVTVGECFYQPSRDLEPGEHKVAITITDSLGLSDTRTFSFKVGIDTEPPRIMALVPAPDSETGTLLPIIAFRCADPSGLRESSLSVVFEGKLGGRSRKLTVIDKGIYVTAFRRADIKPGMRAPYGAGYFEFSEPLAPGETYSVRVGVSDVRNNRQTRTWSFKVTPGPGEDAGGAGGAE